MASKKSSSTKDRHKEESALMAALDASRMAKALRAEASKIAERASLEVADAIDKAAKAEEWAQKKSQEYKDITGNAFEEVT